MASATNETLLKLPFDHYQRYFLAARIIESLLGANDPVKPIRVLDVGGAGSPLKHFLPAGDIVVSDPLPPLAAAHHNEVPPLRDDYFMASGLELPLVDQSFDAVVSCDTLEHIPEPGRNQFISELLRVSGRYTIINGPCATPETVAREARMSEFVQHALGWEHPFLREHADFGLPTKQSIETLLEERGAVYVTIPNGLNPMWTVMMAIRHYLMAFPDSQEVQVAIDELYNRNFSPGDFGQEAYREAFVISRSESDAQALQATAEPFVNRGRSTSIVDISGSSEALLTAMEQHAASVRGMIVNFTTRVSELESQTGGLHEHIDIKQGELERAHESWRAAEQGLLQSHTALTHANQELKAIRESPGFKILTTVRSPARRIFPPGSKRGRSYSALVDRISRLLRR